MLLSHRFLCVTDFITRIIKITKTNDFRKNNCAYFFFKYEVKSHYIYYTFFLYNLENSWIISLNNEDMADELRRHSNDDECPAGGTEHNPIFIQSLLHEVNFDLF